MMTVIMASESGARKMLVTDPSALMTGSSIAITVSSVGDPSRGGVVESRAARGVATGRGAWTLPPGALS